MGSRVPAPVAVLVLCGALAAAPAQATFPGANGKIAHVFNDPANFEVVTVNPDGSARTNITNHPARDEQPKWSPDGTKIAFVSTRTGNRDIFLMNPDGSNPVPLTTHPADDGGHQWSPDGTKIAFASQRDADDAPELLVMDADGSDELVLTDAWEFSWAPDGTRLALAQSGHIYTINVDGSDVNLLTAGLPGSHSNPAWSPDGTTIAFQTWHVACSCGYELWTMRPDGTGRTMIAHVGEVGSWAPVGGRLLLDDATATMNADGTDVEHPRQNHETTPWPDTSWYAWSAENWGPGEHWSPDARFLTGSRRICFDDPAADCMHDVMYVLDLAADTLIEIGRGTFPDWQSMPINGYARPRSAHPVDVTLVPAYEPCTSANRAHGPPLAFPSCSPPVRTAGQLTVGTPDANGQPAKSTAQVKLNTIVGNQATPADEADVRLRATITDVRMASDLSDYTGALEARMTLRITDKDNTPHPGGPGAATVTDTSYSFPVPCAATADATIGSLCTVDTMAEALIPGVANEGARAVWEVSQVSVHDGAGDVFMREGIFVP